MESVGYRLILLAIVVAVECSPIWRMIVLLSRAIVVLIGVAFILILITLSSPKFFQYVIGPLMERYSIFDRRLKLDQYRKSGRAVPTSQRKNG